MVPQYASLDDPRGSLGGLCHKAGVAVGVCQIKGVKFLAINPSYEEIQQIKGRFYEGRNRRKLDEAYPR